MRTLRHTRLTARQRSHQAAYEGLALSKGPTRVEVAKGKREAHSARVEAVRAEVMARANGYDEYTGQRAALQMHECVSRAKTRGMQPEWRFDSRWCLALSDHTHRRMTENKLVALFNSIELGANGGVSFVDPKVPFGLGFTARQVWEHATGRKLN